ncbi:hypothetical protein X975_13532, partial [Stegodyphus mimosarum]
MIRTTVFIFVVVLALGHCSAIPEQPEPELSASPTDERSSTGAPEISTKRP